MKTKRKTRGRRPNQRVELTEAEWEIIKVIWRKQPCTAGMVQEALTARKDWAYSTVKTTMDRMADKGFLSMERLRNLQLFSAELSEVEAKLAECKKVLARSFDGALTPMMQFLIQHHGLSSEEASELRRMIDNAPNP